MLREVYRIQSQECGVSIFQNRIFDGNPKGETSNDIPEGIGEMLPESNINIFHPCTAVHTYIET